MKALLLLAVALAASPAAAADPHWDDYQLIMWQRHPAAALPGLQRLGFTGLKLTATSGRIDPQALQETQASRLPYYLENVATDLYASYHRSVPDLPVTWRFDRDRARRQADPADASVFVREPGLSDPQAVAAVQARLETLARDRAADHPLFYNLGDESGIADLAAPWDYDLAPSSLAAFRAWLRRGYSTLDALNAQWGTAYTEWDVVQPELTDAAMRRTDGNFSAWSDFKAFMDVAFADAVRAGTDAVHRGDPAGLAALEGAQVPGWGGYDYGHLAPAVDVMEIYDTGNALELAHAFNPALIPLGTAFSTGPREVYRVWRELLRGSRGMVIWDEAGDVVTPDGAPGPRGRFLQGLAGALRGVAPALLMATPRPSPVAVLYSQESFRMRWLLDQQPKGSAWSNRDSERENDDNPWRAARRQAAANLTGLGLQPHWLTAETLAGGGLRDAGLRVLMLPHAIALGNAELAEIRAFAARGGTVLADTEPGVFDGHGRRRAGLPLAGVASMPQAVRPDGDGAGPAGLLQILQGAGVTPPFAVLGPDGAPADGVDVRVWDNGGVTILALHAARPWGAPPRITLRLPAPALVRDMRRGGNTVRASTLDVTLDGIEPAVFVLSQAPLPGPALVRDGANVRAALDGPSPAAVHAMRLEWLDAGGGVLQSTVLRVGLEGAATAALPGAASVRAVDPLSGGTATLPLP
ncbi:MAG TPA: alpha-amylase family protein [Acetobacteraceae bacterium]